MLLNRNICIVDEANHHRGLNKFRALPRPGLPNPGAIPEDAVLATE